MKIKPLLKNIRQQTFIKDYLRVKGVEETDKYLKPDKSCLDNCWDYPNMDFACIRLNCAIKNNMKIGILVD